MCCVLGKHLQCAASWASTCSVLRPGQAPAVWSWSRKAPGVCCILVKKVWLVWVGKQGTGTWDSIYAFVYVND